MSKKKKRINYKVFSIFAVVILLFLGISTGYLQYATSYIRCGGSPVIVNPGTDFAGGSGVSHYYTSEDGFLYKPSFTKQYYCSIQDARDVGAKPDSLD